MKKFLTLVLVVIALFGWAAIPALMATPTPDENTVWAPGVSDSNVEAAEMDKDGNLTISGSITAEGSGANAFTGEIVSTVNDMNMNVTDYWDDLAADGAVTAAYAAGVDTGNVSAKAVTITAQADDGRNYVLAIGSMVASGATLAGTVVFVGTTTYGVAVTEILVASQTVTSLYAYGWLTSVTVTITACDVVDYTVTREVGFTLSTGDIIGLSNSIDDAGDVRVVVENDLCVGADSVTIDTTRNTVIFTTDGDGGGLWKMMYTFVVDQW